MVVVYTPTTIHLRARRTQLFDVVLQASIHAPLPWGDLIAKLDDVVRARACAAAGTRADIGTGGLIHFTDLLLTDRVLHALDIFDQTLNG